MEILVSNKLYKAPQAKVVEINVQSVLCQTSVESNGINDMITDPDGGSEFN